MRSNWVGSLCIVLGLAASASPALASSHREAPSIAEDPMADNTDVYAFISPSNPDNMVLVANYVPLLLPSSGPNFYRFADTVRYEIGIDNNGDAVADIFYRWEFKTTVRNGNTFLHNTGAIESIDDADLNINQTYTLSRVTIEQQTRPFRRMVERVTPIATNVPVAPWHVGDRSFPDYESVAQQAVKTLPDGTKMFAGPRDEAFFVDLHVFDLLGVTGTPSTDGFNVMSLVLEVPITQLAAGGTRPAASETGRNTVVGVYARASRAPLQILTSAGAYHFGPSSVQVSRLGWPLVNEAVIPLKDKDKYNRSNPAQDVTNFGAYIINPELNGLLSAVLNLQCEPTPEGGRVDIVGLLSPAGTTPADLLRIDIRRGQSNAQSHFPNGRALEDDVTDTLLTVICNNGAPVGDGVPANDLEFLSDFPYLASPHSGNPGS